MGSDAVEMAIRTVVVSTQAAVRSHRSAGRPDLARESAARGLVLLDDLGLTRTFPNGSAERFEQAHRELESLSANGSGPGGPG